MRSSERGVRKEKNHGPLERHRDEISRCVKCGSCSVVCPPFLHEHAESFSPRGRMALLKAALDGRLGISDITMDRLTACTACLACEASCASKVPVTEIIHAAKEQAREETGTGVVSAVISRVVKHPSLFKAAAWLAPLALHYSRRQVESSTFKVQRSRKTRGQRQGSKGRVVFFPGCAVENFQPDLGRASIAVLERLGYEVIVPEGLKCCGRPLLSLGDRKGAEELATHNSALLAGLEADALVTACASCGLTFKREYPKLLPPDAKKPVFFDIHEFLVDKLGAIQFRPLNKRITVHDPCHLGRGQGLSQTVRDLLQRIPGITLFEMQDADRCCGFGGVMRLTHRGLSDGIAEEKVKNILATGASTVAAGCPGCMMQICNALRRAGSDIMVLHPVQVLAEALGNAECGIKKIKG
jgi:glycolate oxidase iron-sulfur subunit